ncbi:MAG: hypothetical protein JOY83_21550 [Alphaproteobacteria bacterium]|nr:hypothetical protein [Alphaproteobacteria bacterium]
MIITSSQRIRAGPPLWGLGWLLAAIGLLLQVAAPTVYPAGQVQFANDTGGLSAALGEHALCLSRVQDASGDPDHPAPKPAHHEVAACCFWHGGTALVADCGAHFEAVVFARPSGIFGSVTQIPARRLTGAVGPRAPPIQA